MRWMSWAWILFGPLAGFAGEQGSAPAGAPGNWTRDQAAHLLRRAGFGGCYKDIGSLHAMGRDKAVDYLVDFEKIPQTVPDYPGRRLNPKLQGIGRKLSPEDRRSLGDILRRIENGHMQALREWWVRKMILTPRPFEEKMTLFWHGHFCSGFEEVRRWDFMFEQNRLLRRMCLGSFRDLTLAISKDPAMLVYLDGNLSTKGKPNENFARELMELFTLGEGVVYTEKDVLEAARALTGWRVKPGQAGSEFARDRHDDGEKEFLGEKGRWGLEDIVDRVLKTPECSKFLAAKLLVFLSYAILLPGRLNAWPGSCATPIITCAKPSDLCSRAISSIAGMSSRHRSNRPSNSLLDPIGPWKWSR
ncbi:MAG: DUF1800 domain-containing protein [Planctomycetota bacterium]|nr:DUF1800 domain-containing protein [Planctomycetota bacterium]